MLGVDDRSRINVTTPLWRNDLNSKNYIDAELRAKAEAEAAEALRLKNAADMENNLTSLQSTKLNLEKSLAELQVKIADMESKLKQSSSENNQLKEDWKKSSSESEQLRGRLLVTEGQVSMYKTDLEEVKAKRKRTKDFYTNQALALDPEWDGKLVYIFNGQSKTVIDAGAGITTLPFHASHSSSIG
jgi:predicted nuclease with TOPRIM domain